MLKHSATTRVRMYAYPNTPHANSIVHQFLDAGVEICFDLGRTVGRVWDDATVIDLLEDIYIELMEDFNIGEMSVFDIAWAIVNSTKTLPLGDVGTDEYNEPTFFFLLLYLPPEETAGLFESMIDQNPEMAQRAALFYASIPGYSLPILTDWRARWDSPSAALREFLDGVIAHGQVIADAYLGKTFHPGQTL